MKLPQIVQIPLRAIIRYARNPRKNAGAVPAVKASLKEFGWRQPIVLDTHHVIVIGDTRYQAACELADEAGDTDGTTTAPCLFADDLTTQQIQALRLVDNKTHELAQWDNPLLKIELEDLPLDWAPIAQSFTKEELGVIAQSVTVPAEPIADVAPQIDRATELQQQWQVEPGQLWALGNHRLLCGDSTQRYDVEKVLGGNIPLLMVTDPPYGVSYNADWRNHALRADGTPIGGRAIGKVQNDTTIDWTVAWQLFLGDVAYCWHDGRHASQIQTSLEQAGFEIRCQIIWAKQQFVISRGDYHWQHEPCLYAVRKGKVGHWTGNRSQTTLWTIDKPIKSETGHSTQKPLACMSKPIQNNSQNGDLVYDPFLGSGTTLIACEQLGRQCRAIEIDPGYCAVTLQRWAEATQQEPHLL